MHLTATVITLNEESNLAPCLQRLSFCSEILVVDCGSTDATRQIAADHGARVLSREWSGYAAQKNYAAEQAENDWILALDADEQLSDALEQELRALAAGPDPPCAAFSMPRRARYLGRWIGHGGWYPDRKIRLYDRRQARWVGDYVHETVASDGQVRELDGDLLHYTCNSLSEHLTTLDRYTTLAARELVEREARVGISKLILSPCWTFLRGYLFQRGFLDGFQGLVIAVMGALYVFVKYAKARAGA